MRFSPKHLVAAAFGALLPALVVSIGGAQTLDTSSINQLAISSTTLNALCPPNPTASETAFANVQHSRFTGTTSTAAALPPSSA